jgi:hypothetical protein
LAATGPSSNDDVTISGTTNEVDITRIGAQELRVGLTDDVTITGELTVSGTGQSSFGGQVTIPATPSAGTDAASKSYVDASVVGNLVRVGDVLIAEQDAPTALANWTTVQNNIDLADLTTVGIGNVNAGGAIDVSYASGTATVSVEDSTASNKGAVIVAGGTGISVAYNSGTATVTNTDTNTSNTFATTITATGAVTHNFGTKDVIVQLYDTVTDETVYADVERNSTNQVTVTFAATPTNSIRVLVQKIG